MGRCVVCLVHVREGWSVDGLCVWCILGRGARWMGCVFGAF